MTLNSKTRYLWAEKILDLVNIGAGALIFGQFLSDKEFSPILVLSGIALILLGYISSIVLTKNK